MDNEQYERFMGAVKRAYIDKDFGSLFYNWADNRDYHARNPAMKFWYINRDCFSSFFMDIPNGCQWINIDGALVKTSLIVFEHVEANLHYTRLIDPAEYAFCWCKRMYPQVPIIIRPLPHLRHAMNPDVEVKGQILIEPIGKLRHAMDYSFPLDIFLDHVAYMKKAQLYVAQLNSLLTMPDKLEPSDYI